MLYSVVDTRSGKILKENMSLLEASSYLMRKRDRVAIADRPSFMLRGPK